MSPRKTSPRPEKTRRVQSFRPQLEALESRLAPAIFNVPSASLDRALISFDAGSGSLSLTGGPQGAAAQVAATADDLVVTINGQVFSSNAADASFDPALTGASSATLHTINLTGGGTGDALTIDNLASSSLAVQSDGSVTLNGSVQVAGQLTVVASTLTVDGTVQASALTLNSGGLINVEAGGSLLASAAGEGGTITATADYFVNVGQVRADGSRGGSVAISSHDYLNAGAVSASGGSGAVQVQFADSYIDTATASTSASGGGGTISIDGGTGSRLFSSGRFDATGTSGGAIDLFGQDIFLVGATVDASGTTGTGGRVRVGGDYHGGATGFPNAQTVDVAGSTVLQASGAGAGGRVIVWSETATDFTGTVSANGGAAGGFIEVSSHGQLTYGGTADAGQGGTLLLDPKNLIVSAAPNGKFPQFSLINPTGNGAFGTQILQLANGNIAVLNPTANASRGAAYLFNGQTGVLLSVLTGSAANDGFGTFTALTGSNNYLVVSPNWNLSEGAVTWASGTNGVSGVISSATSLVGTSSGDGVGKFITQLGNGNYVVVSPSWSSQRGAVTWNNGTAPVVGAVSAANSLVGGNAGDLVGQGPGATNGVTVLPDDNYVVDSPNWNSTSGAVTWASGASGVVGVVSFSNSLTGSLTGDLVGQGPNGTNGVIVLPSNGNYVVDSPNWNGKQGAVSWGSEANGVSGAVSSFNSLVGSTGGDQVGAVTDGTTVLAAGGVTVLGNGNYVVDSPNWNNGVGAVTLGKGATGSTVGAVSNANSLVGSASGDFVGLQGVTALADNNYVVSSSDWTSGRGAVTFGSGANGVVGTVSGAGGGANSLVGSSAGDHIGGIGVVTGITIGVSGITALPNSNYVVSSPDWTGGEGAVTFGGAAGVKGVVGAGNSLVGSAAGDDIGKGPGGSNGVVVLGNSSNYVVDSPNWAGGEGAVTFGLAASGVKGIVGALNSLIGSAAGDNVGGKGVTVLSNNSYVVDSPNWTGGEGAATFGAAASGVKGAVSAVNSLVGTAASDNIGSGGVVALVGNGNYVVISPNWNLNLGAVTWGSGTAPVVGTASAVNSLIGASGGDHVGGLTNTSLSSSVTPLANGNYVVVSYAFGGGKGAVTFGLGASGAKGVVSAANSLIGSNADGGAFPLGDHVGYNVSLDAPAITVLTGGNFIVSSPDWKGGTGAATWGNNTTGVSGVLSAANSLVGSSATDGVGSGGVVQLTNGNFVVVSPNWNGTLGAATWGSASAGVKGTVGVANSLVGSHAGDSVGAAGVFPLSNGDYVVNSGGWTNFTGAATWANGTNGATLDGLNTIDAQNSVVGSQAAGFSNLATQAGPSTVTGSFLSTFTAENGGQVRIGFTDPTELTYTLAQGQTITVTPGFLTQTLDAGTSVILSANDDITINSAILESGTPGNLTLQAGRSILLNASIDTDGANLSLIANDSQLDGVVDAQRDAGNAVITMAPGVTLSTEAGTLSIDLKNGTDKTNNGAGAATLLGITSSSTTVSPATTLGFTINGSTAGNGTTAGTYTQTNVTGPITLTGASLQVTHSATTSVGTPFTIVNSTGGVTGTFAGLLNNARIVANDGTPFTITYTSNTVVLTQDAITATGIASNLNPAATNTPVTFTATVTNTSGSGGAPTGTVEFFDGGSDIGPGEAQTPGASSATWTFTTSALTLGSHTIQAVYTPTGNFLGSSSPNLTEMINTSTSTVVTPNNDPSTFGELVSFTAAVTSTGGKPTGSVEFFDGSVDLGAGALVSGGGANTSNFVLSTSGLSFGVHSINAVFTASGAFLGSTSPNVSQTVNPAIQTDVLRADGSLLQYGFGGGYTELSPAGTILAVSAVTDGNGLGEVYAITADHHLWIHSPLGWSMLSDGTFVQISAATNLAGDPVVFGVLTDHSLWENGSQFNGWKQLSATGIVSISAVTDRAGNDVVYAITTDNNLWMHTTANNWTRISTGSFLQISAGINTAGHAEVFGVLTDHELWEYDPDSTAGWEKLSGTGTILSISAGAPGEVAAITADHHLWDNTAGVWSMLSSGSFATISATQTPTGTSEVFATLSDSSFWEYDALFPGTHWQDLLASGAADAVAPQRVK